MSGIFFDFDRRQLDEPRQARLARHRHRHPIAQHRVPRQKLLQGLADQLGRVGAGLAENLGILDVVEGLGDDLLGVFVGAASQRLQSALTDVDSPNGAACHDANPPSMPAWKGTERP